MVPPRRVDADSFSSRADTLIELLGKDLVQQEVARWASGAVSQPKLGVFDIRHALTKIDGWKTALREGETIDDPQDLLHFALLAQVIVEASGLPGSDQWLQKLRDSIASGSLDQFEDTVFEGEVALSFMGLVGVRFGPPSGQPDVFADFELKGSRLPFAIECKRIQAVSTASRDLDALTQAFERRCQPILSGEGGLKVRILIHRSINDENFGVAQKLLEQLVHSLPAKSSESEWRSASDPNGYCQVSIARLGPAGVFQEGTPTVVDIPAEPLMAVRAEMVRDEENVYRRRLKSVLSVRFGQAPNPMGNLRDNLGKAMEQLSLVCPPLHGIAALRLRPPKGLGDLWEADRAVRDMLSRHDSEHVALVTLFWDEGSEEQGPPGSEIPEHGRRVVRSLKPYFVANPKGIIHVRGDSRAQYFDKEPEAFYRDPDSGQLIPIAMDVMAAIERGDEFPEPFRQLIKDLGDKHEEESIITLYCLLKEELAEVVKKADGGILIGGINAGRRRFRIYIDRNSDLRIVDFRDRNITAVASIDLRAWLAEKELHYVLSWFKDGFQVTLSGAAERERFLAMSTLVRRA